MQWFWIVVLLAVGFAVVILGGRRMTARYDRDMALMGGVVGDQRDIVPTLTDDRLHLLTRRGRKLQGIQERNGVAGGDRQIVTEALDILEAEALARRDGPRGGPPAPRIDGAL